MTQDLLTEYNFDGLVGPTHNYSGLALGNVASSSNKGNVASPKSAALQGLDKMEYLYRLGIPQAVLPPHERPYIPVLRQLGFEGSDKDIVTKVAKQQPQLLYSVSSASNMWTANAATVSPSQDTSDGRCHFTAANLSLNFHRAIESEQTSRTLKSIFHNEKYFAHHSPLPSHLWFSDEGAANHIRLYNPASSSKGLEIFIYGKEISNLQTVSPKKFPARQTKESFQAIARGHGLTNTLFLQQNPEAIDAGVFHNDVISVGHEDILFTHELAFLEQNHVKQQIQSLFGEQAFHFIEIKNSDVSIAECVKSYLFNSQILTLPDKTRMLLLPLECSELKAVNQALENMLEHQDAIKQIKFMNLRESMRNGGGPACLRLRVAMTSDEINSIKPNLFINDALLSSLRIWVKKHYRDQLSQNDLHDPNLLEESRYALDELTQILKIGSIYPFQIK